MAKRTSVHIEFNAIIDMVVDLEEFWLETGLEPTPQNLKRYAMKNWSVPKSVDSASSMHCSQLGPVAVIWPEARTLH
jgi:hypothetical protein